MLPIASAGLKSPIRFGNWTRTDSDDLKKALKENRLAFLDIDTQVDFIDPPQRPGRGLPVPGAVAIKANLRKLTELAYNARILLLASMDTHSLTDRKTREHFKMFKPYGSDSHCLKGTPGWLKIVETTITHLRPYMITLSPKKKDVPTTRNLRSFRNLGRPVYIQKNDFDVFANPKTLKTLKNAHIDTVAVYGVATDFCVQAAVKSLKANGLKVIVVKDAVKEITENGLENPNHAIFGGVKSLNTDELVAVLTEARAAGTVA